MKTIRRNKKIIKDREEGIENIDTRVALVQALIPIGLECSTSTRLLFAVWMRGLKKRSRSIDWGGFRKLGISLKTTNYLESINSRVERFTDRITYWKNRNQRHRWIASVLLEIEKSMRKIKGYRHFPMLRKALQQELNIQHIIAA